MHSNALVPVQVPGTDRPIMAGQFDGNAEVALRHACDAIGVQYSKQLQKLKSKSWATVSLRYTVAEDGKPREMAMIDRRTFTMWLATIDTSRVNDTARPILEAFQAEAADALDAYFQSGVAVQAGPTSQLDILRAAIDEIDVAQRTATEAKAIAQDTSARLDAIEGRHDWYAALGYARLVGITNTSSQALNSLGRQAASIARHHGIEPVSVPHHLYGTVNSLPRWVWDLATEGRQSLLDAQEVAR